MWRIKQKKYNSAGFIVTDEENILVQHVEVLKERWQRKCGLKNTTLKQNAVNTLCNGDI